MIAIRRARLKDFQTVYDFINELEDTVYNYDRQKEIYKANLSNKDNVHLVALDKEDIVGYLSCHVQLLLHHNGRVAEIQEMFVHREKRGGGIGKLLVDQLKLILQKQNVVQLEAASNNQRVSTHTFYQREGFIASHKKFVWKFSS